MKEAIVNKCIAGIISHEVGENELNLIFRLLDKFVQVELALAGNIVDHQADKQEKIAEATEMIQNGSTVREAAEATGISYRQAAKISKDIHTEENMQKYNVTREVAETVTEIQEAAKQEQEELQVRPTRNTKPITTDNGNNGDNGSDNNTDNDSDNGDDNGDDNEVTEEEFHRRLAEERAKWEQERQQQQQQQQQVVVMNNDEYERAMAYKRLDGLTGLKKAATKHAIDTYFEHKEKFKQLYGNEPGMKFAYTLEDYLDKVREEPS